MNIIKTLLLGLSDWFPQDSHVQQWCEALTLMNWPHTTIIIDELMIIYRLFIDEEFMHIIAKIATIIDKTL